MVSSAVVSIEIFGDNDRCLPARRLNGVIGGGFNRDFWRQ